MRAREREPPPAAAPAPAAGCVGGIALPPIMHALTSSTAMSKKPWPELSTRPQRPSARMRTRSPSQHLLARRAPDSSGTANQSSRGTVSLLAPRPHALRARTHASTHAHPHTRTHTHTYVTHAHITHHTHTHTHTRSATRPENAPFTPPPPPRALPFLAVAARLGTPRTLQSTSPSERNSSPPRFFTTYWGAVHPIP
jgi:hypothetical protein